MIFEDICRDIPNDISVNRAVTIFLGGDRLEKRVGLFFGTEEASLIFEDICRDIPNDISTNRIVCLICI